MLSNGQLTAPSESIGYQSSGCTGTFTQTGGSNAAGGLSIGTNGSYTLTGGTLAVGGLAGWSISGLGSLIVNGGSWSVTTGIQGPLILASDPAVNLSYSLGSSSPLGGITYVGQSGAVSLAQSGGTQGARTIYFGYNPARRAATFFPAAR